MSEGNEDPQNEKDSNISIWICAIGSVLFILALVIAYFAYLQSNFPLFSRGDYATLGDSFGILSSLFSGLAFAGLIVTIVMQNKTLKLQMKELREAKKESARQSKAQEGQEKVMNAQFQAIQLQQFETTFFHLLKLFQEIIDSFQGDVKSFKKTDCEISYDLPIIKKGSEYLYEVGHFFLFSDEFNLKEIRDFYDKNIWSTKIKQYIEFIIYMYNFVDGKEDYIKILSTKIPVDMYFLIAFEMHDRDGDKEEFIQKVNENGLFRGVSIGFENIPSSSYFHEIFTGYSNEAFKKPNIV